MVNHPSKNLRDAIAHDFKYWRKNDPFVASTPSDIQVLLPNARMKKKKHES
jgi:hypothetical protein